ncbi:hypothetical protein EZV62_000468 [Acer yangbiense]|uniref:Uncharacterized protein n=1 Tax=Acer yangbiense TaxID=1000413 RepID=A0A5C7IS23_9ROSI|nr:hypothetical protein EZV62_000468 [Acer yangbiense]
MDSFTFKIFVQTGVNLVEIGEFDVDHISLITLVHAICEKLTGNFDVPTRDYHVWAQIPWFGDKKVPIVKEGAVGEESVDRDDGISIFHKTVWMGLRGISPSLMTSILLTQSLSQNRYCARHIYANFKLTYKGDHYKRLFWRATRSSNIYDFNSSMEEIGIINPAAKKWLEEIDPQHWSRCDHVTNNMTEVFNSMLGTHRAASYLDLLEFIRRMMRKFNERKEECLGWSSVLPPRVHAKILRHGRESRSLKMIAAGNMEYELLGASGGYVVKLREYNC